jgi:polysaccharide biosynthesis protein PslH
MSTKKALIVAPTYPYPIDGGNLVALHGYHVALRAAGYTEVHFVGFEDFDRSPDGNFEQVKLIPKPPKFTLRGLISHCLGDSLLFQRYQSKDFAVAIRKQIAEHHYGAVLFQHGYIAQYASATLGDIRPDCIKVASPEVLESRAFLKKSQLAKNSFLRWLLQRESRILDDAETKAFNQFDQVAFFSTEDEQHFRTHGGQAHTSIVNLGIQVERYPYTPKVRAQADAPFVLAFFGAFSWFANSDALEYLISDIWPEIQRAMPNAVLRIAGRGIPDEIIKQSTDRLQILGRVDSIEDFLADVDVVLSPIRIGGGIRLKILESLAYGKPVISTTIGLEGLHESVASLVAIADTPQEFAAQVLNLEINANELQARAKGGADLVRTIYDAKNLTALFSGDTKSLSAQVNQ